jgi:hypothetical protein
LEGNPVTSGVILDSSIKSLIESIDFNPIVKRMVKANHWSHAETLEGLKQYKNFLFLKRKYHEKYTIPPSIDIDEFWHNHVLHTKKYTEDCNVIFGNYLHHHPHHGENDEFSHKVIENLFEEETQRLHFNEFGTYLYAIRPISYKMLVKKIFHRLAVLKLFNPLAIFLNFSRRV